MTKIDEKEYFDMFALMDKVSKHPKELTLSEMVHLKELGISINLDSNI